MMTDSQRDNVMRWAAGVSSGAVQWRLMLRNRVVTSGAWDVAALLDAIETAASLGGTTLTFTVIALDSDAGELARTDVRIDPKALARAKESELESHARDAAATAQVIAATDHRSVASAFKSNADALGQAQQLLVKMVSTFGEAGSQMMKANVEVIKTLDQRAISDAQTIVRLESELRETRSRAEKLELLAETAVEQAERAKAEQRDLVLMLRASFGDKVSEVAAQFLAKSQPKEDMPQ